MEEQCVLILHNALCIGDQVKVVPLALPNFWVDDFATMYYPSYVASFLSYTNFKLILR